MSNEAKWYVAHTYSGYENKVKESILKTVGNRNMQEQIFEVQIPLEDSVEEKNGKQVVVQRKVFPGYVLINMIMNDDTWYVVRNTRGVDVEVGESVQVMSGPFEGSVGEITKIDAEEGMVVVDLSIFGRETPVELSFEHIKKI